MTDEEWAKREALKEPRFEGKPGSLREYFVPNFTARMMKLAREDERRRIIKQIEAIRINGGNDD
jgi:hypothetical protein